MEMTTTPKVQINGQIRTNAKNEIIEKSLLLNIREDNLMQAIKLFNQLNVQIGNGNNFFPAPSSNQADNNIPVIEQEPTWTFGSEDSAPTCPQCNSKMVRRNGKNGSFWGCSNYSRGCKGTSPIEQFN